ncbi:hypothetical protein [Acidicapsa ligni]|uniref:hypothetical protein n=1 Tax=Acidicapsa ligni TaxID=542300 RepID=UPI0021DF4DC6|nr:hypothetical protein [Acidicapsa ligni]
MPLRRLRGLALAVLPTAVLSTAFALFTFLPGHALGHRDAPKACVTTAEAAQQPNKDICVSAHVYNVVESADGTRFLDVCSTELADKDCRFVILSLRDDRNDVGELSQYRGQEVAIRGTIRPLHGRMGIVLSHARQFSGGPEKFRPNPKLLRGFNGQSDQMPVKDPNLRSSGRHRSFMDTSDKESLPAAKEK